MNPELKAYLDKLRAETKALYDAWNNQFELRATLPTTGAPTPPPTRSVLAASDGGLSIGTTVHAVVTDAFSATTKAREVPAVAHDAPPIYTESAPVTCSTDCSTQVFTVVSVNEVRDAATTVCPDPAVDPDDKLVEQLTPARATSSIEEVVLSVVTTTDVDPKAGVQEPWPPPLRLWVRNMEHPFRPRPWPSLNYDSVAGYHEETYSGTRRQPHEVSGFSVGLVPLPFSDVGSHVSYRKLNSMDEPVICFRDAQLQFCWPPDLQPWTKCELEDWLPPTQHATVVVHLFQGVKNPDPSSAEPTSEHDLQLMQFKQSARIVHHIMLALNVLSVIIDLDQTVPDGDSVLRAPLVIEETLLTTHAPPKVTVIYSPHVPMEHDLGTEQQSQLLRPTPGPWFDYRSDSTYLQAAVGSMKADDWINLKLSGTNYGATATVTTLLNICVATWSGTKQLHTCTCCICLGSPWVESKTLLLELELLIAQMSVISPMQSSHEFHAQIQQAPCARMFSVSTELQGYEGTKLFEFNQETIWLKLPWTSFSGNCGVVHVMFEHYLCGQPYPRVMSMSMHKQVLSQEQIKRSGYFARECKLEQLDGDSRARIQLAVLTSFQYCSFMCRPYSILLIRPLTEKRTSEDKNSLVQALCTDGHAHGFWVAGYMVYHCTLSKIMRSQSVTIKSFEPCATCLPVEMDPLISTEAWEHCGCQHLLSTQAGNLLLDEGYLKFHIILGEINSKMFQSSRVQCVQPTNLVPAYLKMDEAYVAAVHMFEQRTFQDWGLLLYFHQRPPVQHWVIPTYASIQIGGAQCKCVCTAPCLFGKWLVKAGSSQNGKVIYQTSMEYLWKESVIGAMTMTFPITLTSNLCPAGGIIFTSYGPLISSRNCAQLICLDSTTYVGVLPDQVTPLYSARTVDIFGDPLSTTSPLTCHRSIAKGAQIANDLTQFPYTCFVPGNTSLELTDECLLTDLVMGPSCTVPYIIPAVTSNVLDLLNASPSTGFCSRHFAMGTSISLLHIGGISFSDPAQLQCVTAWKIYSRLIPARVATLLGSKLASNYHLEQLWDPGGNALSVWNSQSLEEIVCCRGMLVGDQNSVDAMEFSSRCDQVSFQGGRDVLAVAACFAHGSVDGCNNYYFLGISFDPVAIVHDYYFHVIRVNPDLGNHRDFELVKDHQVQWDPGGSRWRRLGVKPNFKERGMLRALLPSPTWAGPLDQLMGLARLGTTKAIRA